MRELYFLFLLMSLALGAWQDEARIKFHLTKELLEEKLLGKFSNHQEDHLSLLSWSNGNILIGGRDALFNLSSQDLKINSILNWTVSADHQEMCQVKGQKDSDCHNFIRVFHGPIHHHHAHPPHQLPGGGGASENQTEEKAAKTEEVTPKWIICGTNAFKPLCRLYDADLRGYTHEISGVGYSPFDPRQRSTSLLHHGAVYAGTVADFGGSDALIYKNPLRTEQNDLRHLSSPTFVSSVGHGDAALFFFREHAVEHTNCGKAIFSRVARICRHDSGSKKHKDRFTTFLKARLNCSVPGEFPFYFDHIQGTSSVFLDENQKEEMLYAAFTTGENSIGASAICAFKLSDILKSFEGLFKGQASEDANWLPVPSTQVPVPRPGSCHSEALPMPDAASVAFHKLHPLMDESVQGTLTVVYPSNEDRVRVVEADTSEGSDPLSSYHILYIGTQSGKVLKVVVNREQNVSRHRRHGDTRDGEILTHGLPASEVNTPPFNLNSSWISASWQLSDSPIKTLKLVDPTRLLVGTETEMRLLRTSHCAEYLTCAQCIQLRDPHCYWEMSMRTCISIDSTIDRTLSDFDLRQDIIGGDTEFCPQETATKAPEEVVDNILTDIASSPAKPDDCCACGPATIAPYIGDISDFGDNNIPELDGHFRYAGGSPANYEDEKPMTFEKAAKDNFANEIDQLPRKEYGHSFVTSREDLMSPGSIAMATVGSAFIALLVGFSIGFAGSRWLSKKKDVNKTAATNAQLSASIHEQSQRLTSKPVDFSLNINNWNGGNTIKNNAPKINMNLDTLEKTVKKIYI